MVTQVPLPAEEPCPTCAPSMGEEAEARKPESLVSDTPVSDTGLRQVSAPPLFIWRIWLRDGRGTGSSICRKVIQSWDWPLQYDMSVEQKHWGRLPVFTFQLQNVRWPGWGRENTGDSGTSFFSRKQEVLRDYWGLSEGPRNQLEGAPAIQIWNNSIIS